MSFEIWPRVYGPTPWDAIQLLRLFLAIALTHSPKVPNRLKFGMYYN